MTDTDLQGFCANGTKRGVTYAYRYASPIYPGRHLELTIGTDRDGLTVEKARTIARTYAAQVANGLDPKLELAKAREAQATADNAPTIASVAAAYLDSEDVAGLRTRTERVRFFERWITPALGNEKLHQLGRTTVSRLISRIRADSSLHVATKAARFLSAFFNWCALQDDHFRTPMVKGMVKYSPKEHARERILTPAELRDLQHALFATEEPYASLVRLLLLTASRRKEMANLRWGEVQDNMILIPKERMKAGEPHAIPLTPEIRAILKRFAPEVGNPKPGHFVFSTTHGAKPFSGFSKAKSRLDARIAAIRAARGEREPVAPWQIHDLRRTARTLMSEAGVSTDIAERVLAHTMETVRGTYDQHPYLAEKHKALVCLYARLREHIDNQSPPRSPSDRSSQVPLRPLTRVTAASGTV